MLRGQIAVHAHNICFPTQGGLRNAGCSTDYEIFHDKLLISTETARKVQELAAKCRWPALPVWKFQRTAGVSYYI